MDQLRNGQKYAVYMDRMKLYNSNGGSSPTGSNSPARFKLNDNATSQPFTEIMQPSSSPRAMKINKLDIVDIPGAQTATNAKQKIYSIRDHINVNDIIEEGKGAFRYGQVHIDKNGPLLTDEVLGKKKYMNKNNSPLDPQYIVSTKSNRMMIIGDVEGGKPRQFVKSQLRKDTKRYMRVDDIQGASSKEHHTIIPEQKLPELHPMFQNRSDVPREMKEIGNALKAKYKCSNNVIDMFKGQEELMNLENQSPSKGSVSPNKQPSKYKHVHERWLQMKENGGSTKAYSSLQAGVPANLNQSSIQDNQQYYLDQIKGMNSGAPQNSSQLIIPIESDSPIKKSQSRAHYSNIKPNLQPTSRAFDSGGPPLLQPPTSKRIETNRLRLYADASQELKQLQDSQIVQLDLYNAGNRNTRRSQIQTDINAQLPISQRAKSQLQYHGDPNAQQQKGGIFTLKNGLFENDRNFNHQVKEKQKRDHQTTVALGAPSPQALRMNEDSFIKKKYEQIDASPTNFGANLSPFKANNLSLAGDRIVTSRRRMLGGQVDIMGSALHAEQYVKNMKIVPPFAEGMKYGGPNFTPSNRDYGNFHDSSKIDQIITNVKNLRQNQPAFALQ